MIALKQIDLEIVLNHEMVPTPTALFQEKGEMWYPRAKSVLKATLKLSVSGRIQKVPTALWTTDWSNQETVADSAKLMSKYIPKKLMF